MADQNLKRMFKEAAEIAAGVPEELREVAFDRALDALMGGKPRPKEGTPARKKTGKREEPAEDAEAAPGAFSRLMEMTNTEAILQKSLDVLNVATGAVGKKEMTAKELAETLDGSFGLVADSAVVSQVLDGAEHVVRGIRRGGKTFYRLVQPDAPKTGKKDGKKAGGKHKGKTGKKRGKKKPPERPTITEVATDLLTMGFFKAARTVGETVLYLQRRGLEFTARELSSALLRLVRAGRLDRDVNGEGKYQYRSS